MSIGNRPPTWDTSSRQTLMDRFGRVHTNLRVSVTDRCNIRCFYCMPNENVQFRPRSEILTFEEIHRFVNIAVTLGVRKIRLTGGEPLMRANLDRLVSMLASIPDVQDIALTTNGTLLDEQAKALRDAGLQRINISLDGLNEETFLKIARRRGLDRVLAGIQAAEDAGFEKIRLNAISVRGMTESEIVPLGRFARERNLELRFIEFMPLDAEGNWRPEQVLSGAEIRTTLERAFAELIPVTRDDPSQPAIDYRFADGRGRVGFINPVTQPFCESCNRLRITAEGKIRNCLFSIEEWDARKLIRGGADDLQIARAMVDCVEAKKIGHGIDTPQFVRPEKAMYQIGG